MLNTKPQSGPDPRRLPCWSFPRYNTHRLPIDRVILNSIEHQLRGEPAYQEAATLTPRGPTDSADEVDARAFPSRTRRPTLRRVSSTSAEICDTAGSKTGHAPTAPRFGEDGRLQRRSKPRKLLAGRRRPAVRASTTPGRPTPGGSDRRTELVRGREGVRSVGTAITHFPTAVRVMRRKTCEPLLLARRAKGR